MAAVAAGVSAADPRARMGTAGMAALAAVAVAGRTTAVTVDSAAAAASAWDSFRAIPAGAADSEEPEPTTYPAVAAARWEAPSSATPEPSPYVTAPSTATSCSEGAVLPTAWDTVKMAATQAAR